MTIPSKGSQQVLNRDRDRDTETPLRPPHQNLRQRFARLLLTRAWSAIFGCDGLPTGVDSLITPSSSVCKSAGCTDSSGLIGSVSTSPTSPGTECTCSLSSAHVLDLLLKTQAHPRFLHLPHSVSPGSSSHFCLWCLHESQAVMVLPGSLHSNSSIEQGLQGMPSHFLFPVAVPALVLKLRLGSAL
jgi:hypothetical protein